MLKTRFGFNDEGPIQAAMMRTFNNPNKKMESDWLDSALKEIKDYINMEYYDNLETFYNNYNISAFRNKNQGLSFDNFLFFLKQNPMLFCNNPLTKEQKLQIFNQISQNNEFITLQHIKDMFEDKEPEPENEEQNEEINKDMLSNINEDVTTFLYKNFDTSEDAFKFFHADRKLKNKAACHYFYGDTNFITEKEFANGVNKICPGKYNYDTIMEYYNKIFAVGEETHKEAAGYRTSNNWYNHKPKGNRVSFDEFYYAFYNKNNKLKDYNGNEIKKRNNKINSDLFRSTCVSSKNIFSMSNGNSLNNSTANLLNMNPKKSQEIPEIKKLSIPELNNDNYLNIEPFSQMERPQTTRCRTFSENKQNINLFKPVKSPRNEPRMRKLNIVRNFNSPFPAQPITLKKTPFSPRNQFNNLKKSKSSTFLANPFKTCNDNFFKQNTPGYNLDPNFAPFEKVMMIVSQNKNHFTKIFKKILMNSKDGNVDPSGFRIMLRNLGIPLSAVDVEDIVHKVGLNYSGQINLIEFFRYILGENVDFGYAKKNAFEILDEIKKLMHKYYYSAKIAFELNDSEKNGFLDYEKFCKIIYGIYDKANLKRPSHSIMKFIFKYADKMNDNVIDKVEWLNAFTLVKKSFLHNSVPMHIKPWKELDVNKMPDVLKLIVKNKKEIRDRIKTFTFGLKSYIQVNFLIDIIKNVLGKIKLNKAQFRIILSHSEVDSNGFVNFDALINNIERHIHRSNRDKISKSVDRFMLFRQPSPFY